MYEDCLENPGRYFPDDYRPEPFPLIVHEDNGFLPEVPEKMFLDGDDCPPYKTVITGFAVGSLSCTMETPYTCEKNNDGECQCDKDERPGS